jgi:C-methyltransferase C-terminal domain/Putative zinc binding domain/Methyltransferase domain
MSSIEHNESSAIATSPELRGGKRKAEQALPVSFACRFCGASLRHSFIDLGMSPLCENYLSAGQLNRMEPFYPLHAFVCGNCFLVQLQEYVSAESIFGEYAYFSSYSESWLTHAKAYTENMIKRFALGPKSNVVELASNDGYLLQYFVSAGIPALGIEPAANVAAAAVKKGVPTLVKFFNRECAEELVARGMKADLLLGNNVLAQVPDLNSFVAGMKILLKPEGVITMEFPHLSKLMEQSQFDTIYHEHFSYFSLFSAEKIFFAHGLKLFDIEELPTHGGSLRIYACHAEDHTKDLSPRLLPVRAGEETACVSKLESYSSFADRVKKTKYALLEFLIRTHRMGKQVAGYGAPGKGNTLLNYCGIRSDLLAYTVDRNPYKQGKFLPGSHIPIFTPERIRETKPDYVLILPWNLKDEIMQQLSYIREWNGKFVFPIPEVQLYE